VTGWIKPASAGGGGGGRIIDKDNNAGGWFLKMNSAGTSVQFAADQFGSVGTTPGAAAIRNSAANSIALNQWQHVAVTWAGTTDATQIHIYINGQLADDPAAPTNGSGVAQTDAGTPFTIGNRTLDRARNFNGSIDGVRIYNRVLSTVEIQSLVNGGS
jgi:concanavalin A-like lectin/glucanase superfamily protein